MVVVVAVASVTPGQVNAFATGNPCGGKKLEVGMGRDFGALKGVTYV